MTLPPTAASPLIRWPYTVFVAVLVAVYWPITGPQNFLWFSDIALIATVATLWTGSALLASMMALSVWLIELVWALDFLGAALNGGRLFGLTGYMFDPSVNPLIRVFSGSFHLLLVVILPWLVWRHGYDRRALPLQCMAAWLVIPLSYLASDAEQNINWTHGPGRGAQEFLPQGLYLLTLMTLLPLAVYLPSHWLFRRLFPPAPDARPQAARLSAAAGA